jgi:hypothetical protein
MIILGGAGGAYNVLFSNYNIFYNMLKDFIKSKPMTPLGSSLIYNNSGMGSFSYKDLYNTNEGKIIKN